jgi:hypothetical protein
MNRFLIYLLLTKIGLTNWLVLNTTAKNMEKLPFNSVSRADSDSIKYIAICREMRQ